MQDIFERWNQFLLLEKSVSATESLHRVMAYLPEKYKTGYNPRGFPAIETIEHERDSVIAVTKPNQNRIFFNTKQLKVLTKQFDSIQRRVSHHNPELKQSKLAKELKIHLEEIMSAILANVMVHELTHVRQFNLRIKKFGEEFKYVPTKDEEKLEKWYKEHVMRTATGAEAEATKAQLKHFTSHTKPQIKTITSKLSETLGTDATAASKYIERVSNTILKDIYGKTMRYLKFNEYADAIKNNKGKPASKADRKEKAKEFGYDGEFSNIEKKRKVTPS